MSAVQRAVEMYGVTPDEFADAGRAGGASAVIRARFVWNPSCWDTWYLWESRSGNVVGITSLGPLGIYWVRQ